MFVTNGLANVQFPTDVVQIREVDDKQVEIFASKLLPFSLQDVGEAAWDHFKGIEKHLGNGGLYGKSMKVSFTKLQCSRDIQHIKLTD